MAAGRMRELARMHLQPNSTPSNRPTVHASRHALRPCQTAGRAPLSRARLPINNQSRSLSMQLRHSPTSPFVRKVMICAHVKGLADSLTLVATDSTDPDGPLNDVNPLGKVPALTLDNGQTIFDSLVICDYLDHQAAAPRLFVEGEGRWQDLTLGALADGIMEAMILTVYERRLRPEDKLFQGWIDRQTGKVERAVAQAAKDLPALTATPTYGQITMACALGYLDLRAGGAWRESSPSLVPWLDAFAAAVPSFETTKPPAS